MKTKHVVVLPYQESWKAEFIKIKLELARVLGDIALRIEHVGSTSVPGLSAKPIIDIDVVIRSSEDLPRAVKALSTIGYIHEGNLGIEDRDAFAYEGKEHLMEHHLYVCPLASEELKRHISFREYLKRHPEAVAEYSQVKEEAAKLYPEDIDAYIEHKSPVIDELYSKMNREVMIRIARAGDYEAVRRIMNQVQQLHVEWRPDIYKPNDDLITEDIYKQMVESGNLYVAVVNDEIVGLMEVTYRHIETPAHVTRDVVFVDSMAVDTPYRGMGIGHKFFDLLKHLKIEKNLDGIELQVNARNKAAYEMYAGYGFTEKSINMELL